MTYYKLGYWVNRYAKWYKMRDFATTHDLVHWLCENGSQIESIDFIVELE